MPQWPARWRWTTAWRATTRPSLRTARRGRARRTQSWDRSTMRPRCGQCGGMGVGVRMGAGQPSPNHAGACLAPADWSSRTGLGPHHKRVGVGCDELAVHGRTVAVGMAWLVAKTDPQRPLPCNPTPPSLPSLPAAWPGAACFPGPVHQDHGRGEHQGPRHHQVQLPLLLPGDLQRDHRRPAAPGLQQPAHPGGRREGAVRGGPVRAQRAQRCVPRRAGPWPAHPGACMQQQRHRGVPQCKKMMALPLSTRARHAFVASMQLVVIGAAACWCIP